MISGNYTVVDVVQHVHDEGEYRRRRSLSHGMRKLKQKLWLFLVIALFSSGLGFVAVYLPGQMDALGQRAGALPGMSDTESMREMYNQLSEEEKAQAREFLGK